MPVHESLPLHNHAVYSYIEKVCSRSDSSKRIAGPRTLADMMRNHERGGYDWYRACQVFLIIKLHEFSDSSKRQRREIPGGGNQKGSIRRDGMVAFNYL